MNWIRNLSAAFLVALVDDVIEILWARGSEMLETKVVQDERGWTQITLQASFQRVVSSAAIDLLQHLVGVDEEHIIALSTGVMGQSLDEMRLSGMGLFH